MASSSSGGRKIGILFGIVLLFIAVAAIVLGRDHANKARFEGLVNSVMPQGEAVDVSLLVGSEKRDFLNDPRVVEAFREEGFNISVSTMGSLEMAEHASNGTLPEHDFYFPASLGFTDISQAVGISVNEALYLQSNIGLIARKDIAEDLVSQGYFYTEDGHLWASTDTLYELLTSGKRWNEVTEAYQSPRAVGVLASDPTRSFSSAQFAYLMASAAKQGNLATPSDVSEAASMTAPIFTSQGLTKGSSGDSFDKFIAGQGQGTPITVAYDSQYIALRNHSPEQAENFALINLASTSLVMHELIASGNAPEGQKFFDAMRLNKEIVDVMMEYGFAPPSDSNYSTSFREKNGDIAPINANFLSPTPMPGDILELAAELERHM